MQGELEHLIGIDKHVCLNLGGDWMYIGTME